jgi:polyhydroxyalkanoate synthesis regulator phasin
MSSVFVILQYPWLDARPMTSGLPTVLTRPAWPPTARERPMPGAWRGRRKNATPGSVDFLHSFGIAEQRRLPDKAWEDESAVFRADRAMRLRGFANGQTAKTEIEGVDVHLNPSCQFRWVQSESKRVAWRAMLGLRIDLELRGLSTLRMDLCRRLAFWPQETIAEILDYVLDLDLAIPRRGESSTRPVVAPARSAGEYLARAYGWATTSRERLTMWPDASRHVVAGLPGVLVIVDEPLDKGRLFQRLDQDRVTLPYAEIWVPDRLQLGVRPIWILQATGLEPEKFRSLRLCLLRLHAEREAFRLFLAQYDTSQLTLPHSEGPTQIFSDYVDKTAKMLFRKKPWKGIPQSEIQNAIDALEQVEQSGTTRTLEHLRRRARELQRKWNDMIAKREGRPIVNNYTNTSGRGNVVIVNSQITDSFNRFHNSEPKPELDTEMKKLQEQVRRLVDELNRQGKADRVHEVATHIDTLTKQASSPTPMESYLKVSKEGLINAARAVADLAGPIATTVQTIMSLLGFASLAK